MDLITILPLGQSHFDYDDGHLKWYLHDISSSNLLLHEVVVGVNSKMVVDEMLPKNSHSHDQHQPSKYHFAKGFLTKTIYLVEVVVDEKCR